MNIVLFVCMKVDSALCVHILFLSHRPISVSKRNASGESVVPRHPPQRINKQTNMQPTTTTTTTKHQRNNNHKQSTKKQTTTAKIPSPPLAPKQQLLQQYHQQQEKQK